MIVVLHVLFHMAMVSFNFNYQIKFESIKYLNIFIAIKTYFHGLKYYPTEQLKSIN